MVSVALEGLFCGSVATPCASGDSAGTPFSAPCGWLCHKVQEFPQRSGLEYWEAPNESTHLNWILPHCPTECGQGYRRHTAIFGERELLGQDPLWYKDAIIYQVHVRAFYDSSGDGNGDFRGLAQKMDHLQDLGIDCIWLMPFFPSPLRDDGYDISDYRSVNPIYGTLEDFETFLDAAH